MVCRIAVVTLLLLLYQTYYESEGTYTANKH